ncbi:MAG: methyltransferase domain-containing protein [Patescibacteria group bacterium]
MTADPPTRGYGVLEEYLSRRRAARARTVLRHCPSRKSLLDLGCGLHSAMSRDDDFQERFAIDQMPSSSLPASVRYIQQDFKINAHLPFSDAQMNAITMLAVVEHLPVACVRELFRDIHRVLMPKGMLVITTPRKGTNRLLQRLARLRIVSPVEIHEHAHEYSVGELRSLLTDAGFADNAIQSGFFLYGLNTWLSAQK